MELQTAGKHYGLKAQMNYKVPFIL